MINRFKLYEPINKDKIVGIKAVIDSHFYYEKQIRIQLEKAGFNNVYIIQNCIKDGWISIVEEGEPNKSLYSYYVSIAGKLFAILDVHYEISLIDYEIEVNYEITYF